MSAAEPQDLGLEADWRFPSGPWIGFFLQPSLPGRHWMDLKLAFRAGRIQGSGNDWIGAFVVAGSYHLHNGLCTFSKTYIGRHHVAYEGYNEGKGIWGRWRIPLVHQGGFHIWPKRRGESSGPELNEAADIVLNEEALVTAGALRD